MMKLMSVEKWWNEIYTEENARNSDKNLRRLRFVHHETHMERGRRELGSLALEDERLAACATELPLLLDIILYYSRYEETVYRFIV